MAIMLTAHDHNGGIRRSYSLHTPMTARHAAGEVGPRIGVSRGSDMSSLITTNAGGRKGAGISTAGTGGSSRTG